MKKLTQHLLQLSLLLGLMFLYSCGGDSEDPVNLPAISINKPATGGTIAAGEALVVNFDVTAAGGYNNSTIDLISGGQTLASLTHSREPGITTNTFNSGDIDLAAEELFDVTEALAGEELEISITVVDDLNQSSSVSVFITVTSAPLNSFSAILLAAPTGNLENAAFFSSESGETYSPNDVTGTSATISPTIDFGYYYGTGTAQEQASLASPTQFAQISAFAAQVANWSTLRATMFASTSMTESQFNETTTFAAVESAFDGGTNEGQAINNLTAGQVIAFQTDSDKSAGSRRGLILIKGITGTDGSDGRLEIDVIVQK